MNCYCHATSFENAQKIEVEGFHLGQNENQEAPTYKDKSPKEIKARRYQRLDDLETDLLNENNHTILTDPWFKNPGDACMKTLRNYLHHHIQFRDEFPELKDELDYRINRLISTLNSQIVKNKEFQSRAACLLAGIGEFVKSNDCKDEMISTLRNFLRNHRIEGPLDYFDNTDRF